MLVIPFKNTYVKIGIQAYNEKGYSDEAFIIVRTSDGKDENDLESTKEPFTASQLPLVPIIGTLFAVLIILIILIDVSCYKINEIGITNFLCEKAKRFKKFDPQIESAKLNGQSLTSTSTLQGFGSGIKENSPLLETKAHNRVQLTSVNAATTNKTLTVNTVGYDV